MFLLVVNPAAGKGRGAKILPSLVKMLGQKEERFELALTEKAGDETEFVQRALQLRGYDKIIAAGGDGTANKAAQELVGTEIPLGIIPTGSGNDIARALDIPLNLKAAVELACSNNTLNIDVGKVLFGNDSRYFLNVLGIGFDAQIAKRAQNTKGLPTDLAYGLAVLKEIFVFQEDELVLEMPEWKYEKATFVTLVANGWKEGKFFQVAPESQLNDGLFDICVIESMSPFQRFCCVLMAMWGQHLRLPKVHYKKAREIKISLASGGIYHLDGDPFRLGPGQIKVEILPQALKVIPGPCREHHLLTKEKKIKALQVFTNLEFWCILRAFLLYALIRGFFAFAFKRFNKTPGLCCFQEFLNAYFGCHVPNPVILVDRGFSNNLNLFLEQKAIFLPGNILLNIEGPITQKIREGLDALLKKNFGFV